MKIQSIDETAKIQSVIRGGYCIGCGVCTVIPDSPISIALNDGGKYQAQLPVDSLSHEMDEAIAKVCPFSGHSPNEDEIARGLFSKDTQRNAHIGFWRECFIGHVEEGNYRSLGSSGGFVSWLLDELVSTGEIDGVLHVVPSTASDQSSVFFKYGVSTTSEQVRNGAKSRYYGVELSQALKYVRDHPGRYVIVGVPCFVKSIRLLCRQDPLIAERIRFTVAILCGQLKSVGYLEYLAWQMGVPLDEIQSFDFRHKIPANPARNYAVQIVRKTNGIEQTYTSLMSDLRGEDWGIGLFKYSACDFCDDVMGETADVCAGDAWVEPYSSDADGTNVLVLRNKLLHEIVENARISGRLSLASISPEIAAQTQEGSFRHRRDGLAYRLWLKQKSGKWAPRKRVKPEWRHLSRKKRRLFQLRISLVELSDKAYRQARKAGDFNLYWPVVRWAVWRHRRFYNPLWKAIPRRLWKIILHRVGQARRSPRT